IYPGLLPELAFLALLSSPFWMPASSITAWVFLDVLHQVPDLLAPPQGRRRRLAAAALGLASHVGLLRWAVARPLAFLPARPAFDVLVAAAPRARAESAGLDRRLGVYQVDRIAADPRGGVYFRTRSGPDGLYVGRMNYGFAYRPNPAGSPFGDDKYSL